MAKLHKYRYTNDIFRKVSIIPKGKSHGLVMFLDMSGSMSDCYGPTIEQTLILTTFCKRVGIPFDVYGFSDNATGLSALVRDGHVEPKLLDTRGKFNLNTDEYSIKADGFHLCHLLSSSSSANQYRRSFGMMATLAFNYKSSHVEYDVKFDWRACDLNLNGTPFVQTLIASRQIIDNFKSKYKSDIVNTVYLTDGEGASSFIFKNQFVYDKATSTRIYLVDRKTKMRMEFNNQYSIQAPMTEFIRRLTGCKHIAFYLSDSKKDFGRKFEAVRTNFTVAEQLVAEKTMKTDNFFEVASLGYDHYFYTLMNTHNVQDEELMIRDTMTTKRMVKVFSSAQNSKSRNRVLISRFAKEIAA
jgi:hypothetical protein